MKCKSCGAEFDVNFCPYCGEKQVEDDVKENEVPVKNIDIQPKSKAKKPIYKKWWFWVIVVLLFFGIVGSLGDDSANEDATEFNWSNMVLGDLLPLPESNLGKNLINTEDYLYIDIINVSVDDYKEYVNSCRENGFDLKVDEYDFWFDAQNEDGYELSLYYYESDEELSIDLTAPDEETTNKDTVKDTTKAEKETKEQTISQTEQSNDNENSENTPKDYIESFVSSYNNVAKIPITERVKFDPKDRESGYYRTEYRLTAWDGSVGEVAKIGNAKIEMVNYGSYGGYYDNNSFRVYVTADSVEDILEIFPVIAKVMDSTVTDVEIHETIEHVKEYGDENGLTIGNLSGYISQTEMMLD